MILLIAEHMLWLFSTSLAVIWNIASGYCHVFNFGRGKFNDAAKKLYALWELILYVLIIIMFVWN